MDPFVRLAQAAKRQHEEGDLPSRLLEEILEIACSPALHSGNTELVERLIRQVEDFDSYAGAGCFGDSVSAGTIEATVRLIASGGN